MTNLRYNVEVNGKKYSVTDQNHLSDVHAWDPDIRDWLADKANIQLQDEHHTALEFIRTTYHSRERHPMVRVVAAHLAEKHGEEKGSLKYFYNLFPKGIYQAVVVAGVPITGLCY